MNKVNEGDGFVGLGNVTGGEPLSATKAEDNNLVLDEAEEARKREEEEEEERQNKLEEEKRKRNQCIGYSIIGIIIAIIVGMVIVFSCKDRAIRDELNKQNGFISDNMKRVVITPRADMWSDPAIL